MSAYPQAAFFNASSAIQVSSDFLNRVQGSLPNSELAELEREVLNIPSETHAALNTIKDQVPYQGLREYLELVFHCTVVPVEAIAMQLTFVLIADLGAENISGDGYAIYKNKNGDFVDGEMFAGEAKNYYGLTGQPERWTFYADVVRLHQNLRYQESPLPKFSVVGMRSTRSDGKTVVDYFRPECRNELKSVAWQTVEFVRRINKSLQKIESKVLSWRSALGFVEDSKPKFWLGENAKSFDLAMVELRKLFSFKEPRITSPIRDVRLQLAQRVHQIPKTEILTLIESIERLQEQIALIQVPVGEALLDFHKFRLLDQRRTLQEQLDDKCARLLQIRQDLASIHDGIAGDFLNLDELLGTFKRDIERTRSRFLIKQVPKFFGDTKFASPGIIFERAGSKIARINMAAMSKMDYPEKKDKAAAFMEGSGKEVVGRGVVNSSSAFVSAAQAGEVSKAFLTSMKVAPLIGVLVQIGIDGSDMAQESSRIIDALRESLPIPNHVFTKFVQKEIKEVFDENRLKKFWKTIISDVLLFAISGPAAVVLAGALTLAEKIDESEEYKELLNEINEAVARGFKEWEKSLTKSES